MTQAEKERAIFLEFAPASGIDIDTESVENRDPPEPDIVCQIAGRGTVGFELTELIDQGFMARLDLMARTKSHLAETWRSGLTNTESSEFSRKYGNALLHFSYANDATLRKREAVTIPVFRTLLHLSDDYEGTVSDLSEFSPVVEEVRVSRGEFTGPVMDTASSGLLDDPTATTFLKKLSKTYECDYPVELLAYIEIDLLPHEDVWKAAIDKLAHKISKSPFGKVWVFDRGSRSVKYEKSPLGPVSHGPHPT